MKIVFVLLLALAWISPGLCGWNPCDVKQAGKDNTMCKYKKGVFGKACTKDGPKKYVITSPLTKKQQKDFVDRMNTLRQKVASGKQKGMPAGTIPDLKWDDGLAAIAQRWTDQCPDGHDKNRATAQFPHGAGQNFYEGWAWTKGGAPSKKLTQKEIDKAINLWYGEVKNFVHYKCPIDKFSSKCVKGKKDVMKKTWPATIGHFTQLIWAKTTRVGCGWIRFKSKMGTRVMDATTIICDFGPAGNMGGVPIYKKK